MTYPNLPQDEDPGYGQEGPELEFKLILFDALGNIAFAGGTVLVEAIFRLGFGASIPTIPRLILTSSELVLLLYLITKFIRSIDNLLVFISTSKIAEWYKDWRSRRK